MKNILAALFAILIILSLILSGCSLSDDARGPVETDTEASGNGNAETEERSGTEANSVTEVPAQTDANETEEPGRSGKSAPETGEPAGTDNTSSESGLFTERDLEQSADLDGAVYLEIRSGSTVTVDCAGVYVLKGSAENACVLVDAADDEKVQLVLDGVSIVNSGTACILVENADKVFVTSAEDSVNTLSVTGSFTVDEDAVIFSRDDLVLNGLGSVEISSSGDGIRSGDDLKLTGGTWNVTVSGSALKAHDSILACGGTWAIRAGSDGLHAEDSDDASKGSIVIEGGSFTVTAGDDGIHATTAATVNGGTLTVSAAEGIEATQVIINDGTIDITATDDGINAGRKTNTLNVKIEINGGDITIVMGQGDTDGIDSNGDLVITGGTIDVTAQSPFDYDGTCTHTGGTIIVNGTQTDSVTNQMMGGMRGGQGGAGMNGFGGKRQGWG